MTMRNYARAGLLAGAGVIALAAYPAFAADNAAEAANTSAGADTSGLTEIVVTATKRETKLQDTPIAIAVMDSEDIKKRHVQSLLDLADGGIPSLRVATFEARQSALTVGIRGIVPFDQNQTARDTGVGVYIDGVYLGRSQGLNAALFDVQRIEVLRGPQGTLFGRNTEGGAVSIVTREPTGEFGGRASAGVGNYGSYTGEAHIDLPAFANLALKFDGLVQHQSPTVKNPLSGQAGWNQYQRVGGRVSAKWTPFAGFTALLSFDKAKDENTPFYSQLINYNPQHNTIGKYVDGKLVAPEGTPAGAKLIAPLSPLVHVSGDKRQKTAEIGVPQQVSVDRTQGFTANLRYELAPSIEVRSISAWRKVSTEQWDNSGGAHRTIFQPNTNFSRYSLSELHQRQFSQELQLVGSTSHLDFVAGLYYFNERAQEEAATPSSNKWNADGTGYLINSEFVNGPITSSNQGWDRDAWFRQRGSFAYAKSYAAYGQFTWTPAGFEQLHITAGGRYTRDKRHGTLYIVQGKDTNFLFDFKKNRFDPMVTVALDAAKGVNLYAKYSTGYRAGGANSRSQTFAPFGPETVKSYEVGAKMDMLDNHVRLNLAGYYMRRNGTQTDFDNVDTNPNSPTFNLHTEETRNAPGTSKIKGLEVELTVRPVEGLTLGASYAYTDVKVPPTPNPFLGNKLFQVFTVFTPKNALSGDIEYEAPLSSNGTTLRLHLDANYADEQYSFQNEDVKTQPSFVVNGRIAIADIPLGMGNTTAQISLWSRNLFNETHIYRRSNANGAILGDYANFNPPRTFGVEGTISF
jgi:iron complex outermembrane receptor protein